jgi:N-acetylmuramoyl-L-alanine amidase
MAGLLVLLTALPVVAQNRPNIQIERGDGSHTTIAVQLDRGYASVPLTVLGDLGWTMASDGTGVTLTAADEITIELRLDTPFFRWDGLVLQFSDPPYRAGGVTYVPLQLLTDFLPRRLPGLYDFTGSSSLLRAGDLKLLGPRSPSAPAAPQRESAPSPAPSRQAADADEVRDAGPSSYSGVRVVIIDPGHGGADPGALGPGGLREKAVALAIALRLEALLRTRPDLEVHMIRDDDTFVDVWERGQIATNAKGERPGVFLSIHANSFPTRREARGFETYFLSDARTEHERRVSAIENAPLSMRSQGADEEQVEDLDFILRDLRNYEYAHWSENLAGLVQDELNDFHPGPNRGVKQGVLAVLTNALMPSVLIEVGYLSNSDEAQLLAETDFHASAARGIADAVGRFFERYPPGGGTGSSREDP